MRISASAPCVRRRSSTALCDGRFGVPLEPLGQELGDQAGRIEYLRDRVVQVARQAVALLGCDQRLGLLEETAVLNQLGDIEGKNTQQAGFFTRDGPTLLEQLQSQEPEDLLAQQQGRKDNTLNFCSLQMGADGPAHRVELVP